MFPFNDIKNHVIVAFAGHKLFAMVDQEPYPIDSWKNL